MKRLLSYREKKLFIICVAMIGIGVVFSLGIQPMILHISTLDQQINSKRGSLMRHVEKIKHIKESEREVFVLLNGLKKSENADQSMARFVSDVEKTARHLNIKTVDLKPQKPKEEEFFHIFSLNLTLTGRFIQILEFVYILQNNPYCFLVEEFFLENNGSPQDDLLKVRLMVSDVVKTQKEEFSITLKDKKSLQNKDKIFENYIFLKKRDVFSLKFQEELSISHVVNLKEEFIKDYKISGVILDANPMVIIQDIKKKRILFLSKGEKVNGFKITEIHEEKIILEKQHQKIEVHL